MSYNPTTIRNYFDEVAHEEWERLTSSPLAEISLFIHSHYLNKFIPPKSRVLEIGAGPGRFTEMLHALQCKVVVADLSKVQLDLNKQFAADRNFVDCVEKWIQLDICNMQELVSESFDVVLAYGGPLSYVLDKRDIALQECLRVLKPGGLQLASVMSLWGSAHRYLGALFESSIEVIHEIFLTGDMNPRTQPENTHYCHMFKVKEYRDFLINNGFELMTLSASNTLSTNFDALLLEIRNNEESWSELLKLELEACAEEGYLDGGTHIIAVARKPL